MDNQNPTKGSPQQGAAQDTSDPTGKIAQEKETQRLLELGKTEAGRKAVFEMYGVREQDRVLDAFGEVGHKSDDPEGRAAFEQLERDLGGPEGAAKAASDLAEAGALFNVDGEWEGDLSARSRADEATGIREIIAEYREALESPEKARALLEAVYQDPSHPYFSTATPEMVRGMNRLWRASHGEPTDPDPPRRRGDGEVR